jgi:hypothetical protein
MAKMTSTGVLLGVSAAEPATFDGAGYAALTWTNVGELIDLPEFGPTVQVVESNPLATGITEKRNGFINFGSVSLGLELDMDDAGQIILEAGVTVPPAAYVEHSFRVTYPDGTIEYFSGGIFSYTRAPGSANSMIGSTVQVEINTPIIRVP